jgi:hypothetical protein
MDYYSAIETRFSDSDSWDMYVTRLSDLNVDQQEYFLVFGLDWRPDAADPWVSPCRGLPADLSKGAREFFCGMDQYDVVVRSYITLAEILSDSQRAERILRSMHRMRMDDDAIVLRDRRAHANAFLERSPSSFDLVVQVVELMVVAARSVGAEGVRWVSMAIQ